MSGESEEKDNGANGEVKPADSASEKASDKEEAKPASTSTPADPVAEAKAEAAKMKDQWMRTAADFDNFRKRSRRELEDARKAGKEDILKEFLPVFDNLERAIQSAQRATDLKGVAEGLAMVLRQYVETLGRGGITKVPTIGAQFDPTHHEAIQQVESDEPPGSIVAEVQPGYMQGERLIRAAMVVVAKPKAKTEGGDGGGGAGADTGEAQ